MPGRKERCESIVSDIENLKAEWRQERDRVFDLEDTARDLNDDLRNAEFELAALALAQPYSSRHQLRLLQPHPLQS